MDIKILKLFMKWLASWMDMLCGFISIITFCWYRPWWDFTFRIWSEKYILKLRSKKK